MSGENHSENNLWEIVINIGKLLGLVAIACIALWFVTTYGEVPEDWKFG